MKVSKAWRLSWVAILVVSAFFLGMFLRPDTRRRPPPALNFGGPSPSPPPGFYDPRRMPPPPMPSPAPPPGPGGWR